MLIKTLTFAHSSEHPSNYNWIQNDHPTSYIYALFHKSPQSYKQAHIKNFLIQDHLIMMKLKSKILISSNMKNITY